MTTPHLPDSPAVHVPAQRSAPVGPAPFDGAPSRGCVAPGSSGVEATVRVPAQRRPVAPETVVGPPPEQQVLSPAPVLVGRDTRLAVLWMLLGATTGVLALVAAALVLPLF